MIDFLDYASSRYYEGSPIISDEEFDRLAKEYEYKSVGHVIDSTRAIKHRFPLKSLKKFYPGDVVPTFKNPVKTPKLDGAAVSLQFVAGKLALALTRGDGIRGYDITDKMSILVQDIQLPYCDLQIDGEVVAPKSIENARNYASGSLGLKSLEEFKTRNVQFVAYSVKGHEPEAELMFWNTDMALLEDYGFTTVCSQGLEKYPQDGVVVREDNYELYHALGQTSNHPKGAYALKEQKEAVVTKLLDVKWQVGRTGVVSPVAILEPVKIGDATVARATLHNIAFIEEMGLELGCDVELVRSGEIIPRIMGRA